MPADRTTEREPGKPEESGPPVNVERLADRVYRLMLADVRLERARLGGVDQLQKSE